MAYNKMVYRINYLGEKIYCNVDEAPKTEYTIELTCDKCGHKWAASTSNWFVRKKRKSYIGDFCSSCTRSGERNPAFGKNPCRYMSSDEVNTLRNKQKNSSLGKNNAMYGKTHSVETRALQSKSKVDLIAEGEFNIKSCNRGRKAYYVSTKSNTQFYADSILELARMVELDNDANIVSWTKYHSIRIPYIFDGVHHNYVPDFLLQDVNGNTILEEVKGRKEPIDVAKEEQAIIYCNNNNYTYRMIMGKDLHDPANYKKLLKETK